MRRFLWSVSFLIVTSACGCQPATDSPPAATSGAAPKVDPEQKIAANLAQLDPDDRTLAEAQRFCAIATEGRLGSMGPPIKLMIEDQPVFLCCDGCKDEALANPEKTLARVESLKKDAAAKK